MPSTNKKSFVANPKLKHPEFIFYMNVVTKCKIKSCFQTLVGSVACYLSALGLPVIWHQISSLFLPRLGCIVTRTPNLLQRLWPCWNASTNTQPLPLSLTLAVIHSHCFIFFVLNSPTLPETSLAWLPACQKMGTCLLSVHTAAGN